MRCIIEFTAHIDQQNRVSGRNVVVLPDNTPTTTVGSMARHVLGVVLRGAERGAPALVFVPRLDVVDARWKADDVARRRDDAVLVVAEARSTCVARRSDVVSLRLLENFADPSAPLVGMCVRFICYIDCVCTMQRVKHDR